MISRRLLYPLATGAMAAVVWWLSPKEASKTSEAPAPSTAPDPGRPHRDKITALGVRDQILLSGDAGGVLARWDLKTGALIDHWSGHGGPVRQIDPAPEGGWITHSGDGTVAWWGADTQIQRRARLTGRALNDGVPLGPGESLVVDDLGSITRLLDEDRRWRKRMMHKQGALSVAVSPDGDRAISGGADGSLALWGLDGAEQGVWMGHEGFVSDLAWAPQGILSAGEDRHIKLWAPPTATVDPEAPPSPLKVLDGHTAPILALHAVGDRLASGGEDGTVRLWSIAQGAQIGRIEAGGVVYSVLQVGDQVIAGGDASLQVWQIDGPSQGRPLHPGPGSHP